MQDYLKEYYLWRTDPYFSKDLQQELENIKENPTEIEDRFYRDLAFGTGGLRGILGAGRNRMNVHTVSKASAGLAKYIVDVGGKAKEKGVVISYDSRHFSPVFAEVVAGVMTAFGIKAYLSDTLRPVPMLSFAVRYYKAFAGVMITASHNPPKYNGYKVYGSDGGQVTLEAADKILQYMNDFSDIREIKLDSLRIGKEKNLLVSMGEDLDKAYIKMLEKLLVDPDAIKKNKDLPIVYTPLHGSAYKPVISILETVGFTNVSVVKSQALPDGNFPTVTTPNPEDPKALSLGIALAQEVGGDFVMGTDPDGDRVGVAVCTNAIDEKGLPIYQALSGNQVGILLLDYILSSKQARNQLPPKSFAVTTIVSSKLAAEICRSFQVDLHEVLTGFKFIGEKIRILDEEGDEHFQFGFEESYGYLAGVDVRDKDAVVSSLLIANLAATCKAQNQTWMERLELLYQKYGFGLEEAVSFTLEGKEGVEKIAQAMNSLRQEIATCKCDNDNQTAETYFENELELVGVRDYLLSEKINFLKKKENTVWVEKINLPASDVLYYELGGEKNLDWACIRPSGTEPKLKIYAGVYGENPNQVQKKLEKIKIVFTKLVEKKL